MTSVDIDKLKELLASQGWVPWPHRIVPPSAPAQELCIAAVNSLAALIAKAERVDALEDVTKRLIYLLDVHRPRFGDNESFQCTQALTAARNTISPKESEK